MTKHIVQALEAALGTDDFAAVLEEVKKVRGIDLKDVAKEFTRGRRQPTDRKALKQIWSRHQSIVQFKAKLLAIGERSAA